MNIIDDVKINVCYALSAQPKRVVMKNFFGARDRWDLQSAAVIGGIFHR